MFNNLKAAQRQAALGDSASLLPNDEAFACLEDEPIASHRHPVIRGLDVAIYVSQGCIELHTDGLDEQQTQLIEGVYLCKKAGFFNLLALANRATGCDHVLIDCMFFKSSEGVGLLDPYRVRAFKGDQQVRQYP